MLADVHRHWSYSLGLQSVKGHALTILIIKIMNLHAAPESAIIQCEAEFLLRQIRYKNIRFPYLIPSGHFRLRVFEKLLQFFG
jgi:hypothetical protein